MLNRIGKVDFFAVLPAGFYVFVVFLIVFGLATSPTTGTTISIWKPISDLVATAVGKPVTLVLVLFGSYLIGSSLRAFPVKWAEKATPPFRLEFPYPLELQRVISELEKQKEASGFNPNKSLSISDDLKMSVFNYWKDKLCMKSPDGFSYYQSFEARTRYFAGMFWAGCIGVIGGLIIIFQIPNGSLDQKFGVLVLSIMIMVVFGGQFRRVREQEARVLVSLFAVLQQDCVTSQQVNAGDGKKRGGADAGTP